MIERRPFAGLGGADHGWLDTRRHRIRVRALADAELVLVDAASRPDLD